MSSGDILKWYQLIIAPWIIDTADMHEKTTWIRIRNRLFEEEIIEPKLNIIESIETGTVTETAANGK